MAGAGGIGEHGKRRIHHFALVSKSMIKSQDWGNDHDPVRAAGARGLLSGTPPALALSCVEEGVRLVGEAGIDAIRAKGIALTSYAIDLVDARLARDRV